MQRKYRTTKTENGWEVWDGFAFENPPNAYATQAEAMAEAERLNQPTPSYRDETAGSVLTGRDWD